MLKNWILIGVLAAATYLSRLAGLEFMAGREMGPTLKRYFTYVPIAIIAALLVKQIFVPVHGELSVSFPVLIACFFTAISMRVIKVFLPSIIIGIVLGLAARYLFLA
ncbi:MAG: AzlD domain-containing protein [Sporolactobacillus sp.]